MVVITSVVPSAPPTIAERTREAGGLLEVSLGDLREEIGYAKLGRWVLDEVRQHLTKNRLGVFPADRLDPAENAEPRQWQKVWVYERDGSVRAQVIDAVLHPDEHDVRAALDGLAAGDASALTAEQKLDCIRDILGPKEAAPTKKSKNSVKLKVPRAS